MATETAAPTATYTVDIVSDVVCPWCVIGYRQLEIALGRVGGAARVRWRAFELNPDMSDEGEELASHVARKYGASAEDSAASRARMVELGAALGFAFNFTPDSRIRNTFRAHQLLRWAGTRGRKHALKLALFAAHFTQNRDVNDPAVLAAVAAEAGLDGAEAAAVLEDARYAQAVRDEEAIWPSLGIQGVPTFFFNESQALTGAQPVEVFEQALIKLRSETPS